MKNYIAKGDVITLTAPYTVVAGACLKVGSIVGVATTDAASSATVEAAVRGVFDLAKVSAQAWTVGAPIYWDDSAKLTTTTSTSNTLIGVDVAVAANPSATGRVRLNGSYS